MQGGRVAGGNDLGEQASGAAQSVPLILLSIARHRQPICDPPEAPVQ